MQGIVFSLVIIRVGLRWTSGSTHAASTLRIRTEQLGAPDQSSSDDYAHEMRAASGIKITRFMEDDASEAGHPDAFFSDAPIYAVDHKQDVV